MLRIRRRFALLLCAVCVAIFLTLYFVMGHFIRPVQQLDSQPNFGALQMKLQQLETGLQKHGQEMRHMQNRLDKNLHKQKETAVEGILKNQLPADLKKVQQGEKSAKDDGGDGGGLLDQCNFDGMQSAQTDLQMLDLYKKMSFKDIDGGVWKQGWNINYDPLQFNEHHKLQVFVVPHSHNDPGWLKTFDVYYQHQTKFILSNALRHLRENPEMRFIWAEISYFARFYEELGPANQLEMKKLVQNGQLEFVTGGWVMTDEANSHWLSVLLQLTEGQTWLKQHMNVTPTNSWSIDPFGYSPTLPYVLQKSGMKNLLIQRTHYSVKKEFALKRQLEFNWRQLWDDAGTTDLFTHMMPFYSYDIPHTCGPDPKICCQFDFKRMPGFGLSCPWGVSPTTIDEHNVAKKAEMIVDQWKKKAELFRTNAVLIPLGDDFRFSESTEWDVQRMNYQTLFDHINAERNYFVEAKFGTLQDYFEAVHRKDQQFPSLSGDFFTYADRSDNYWSGYFTSRPYHKRMDRVLLHYVRSAEMLAAWNVWGEVGGASGNNFAQKLEGARRELSLFQHHDGITGTAKTHVVLDYAERMLDAVKACRLVMQQAVYRLLTKPAIYNPDFNFNYFYLDDSRWPGPDDTRTTIILGEQLPRKHVVFHNSLPQWREEIVDFYVSSPYMSVSDFHGNAVPAQVNPVWTWHRHTPSDTITPQGSTTKYRLLFKVRVPPLGLVTYIIKVESMEANPASVTVASNLILTTSPISVNLGDYPKDINFGEHRELSLRVGDAGPSVAFSTDGLLKSIQIKADAPHAPVHLKFLKYRTRSHGDRSGAYLFLPNGPATPFVYKQPPVVLVQEGPLESSVTVGLPFVVHQTVLRVDQPAPEIRNLIDIENYDDHEIVMRLSTHIQSGTTFYTDLNGLQIIKRELFTKLPLQANYYPVPSAIYIEDATTRLTLVSAQPLGGSSLDAGELEIMQDRRLTHDDERGVGQGVLDNKPVLHIFQVLLEQLETGCDRRMDDEYPLGALTLAAYRASKAILHPVDKFIFAENEWLGVLDSFGSDRAVAESDVEIVALRTLAPLAPLPPAVARNRKGAGVLHSTGIIVHRTNILKCPANGYNAGVFDLRRTLQFGQNTTAVHSTTLTFLQHLDKLEPQQHQQITICPMDTKAFIVQHRS